MRKTSIMSIWGGNDFFFLSCNKQIDKYLSMKNCTISFIFFYLSIGVFAQKNQQIPFRLTTHNNIVIKAILNQKDTLNLMFHTGASDVTLIEEAIPKMKTIQFKGKVDSVGSWGGNNNSSDFSVKNSLKIADFDWQNITVWKDKYSGPTTDGKCGLDLFENKFLAFDFDKNLISISTKLPKNTKKYEQFALEFSRGLLFIKAICEIDTSRFGNKFMIHSGYAGDILLDDKFANDNKIGQRIKITGEKVLKDSFGNSVVTKKGILPMLKLGNMHLENVPVGFFEGTIGRQQMSIIGGDVLKRFNWIIDADRKYIYLKPNGLFKMEYSKV
jgi:hypothetical protein